jgi:hypothetical protein
LLCLHNKYVQAMLETKRIQLVQLLGFTLVSVLWGV